MWIIHTWSENLVQFLLFAANLIWCWDSYSICSCWQMKQQIPCKATNLLVIFHLIVPKENKLPHPPPPLLSQPSQQPPPRPPLPLSQFSFKRVKHYFLEIIANPELTSLLQILKRDIIFIPKAEWKNWKEEKLSQQKHLGHRNTKKMQWPNYFTKSSPSWGSQQLLDDVTWYGDNFKCNRDKTPEDK